MEYRVKQCVASMFLVSSFHVMCLTFLLLLQSIPVENPPVMITCGNIYSEVVTHLQYVTHKIRIYHSNVPEARSLDIQNMLDTWLSHTSDFEFVMRIESDIQNVDREFFTDLNGFQVCRQLTYPTYFFYADQP